MTRPRFMITGLPRSRTAWFAVAAGCPHEPIAARGYAAYRPHWKDGCGVSDSHAGLYLRQIINDLEPRIVVIDRPIGDVAESLARAWLGRVAFDPDRLLAYLMGLQRAIGEFARHPSVRLIPYHDLNDLGCAYEAFDWLGVNPENLDQLMHMNITSDMGWNLAQVRDRAA